MHDRRERARRAAAFAGVVAATVALASLVPSPDLAGGSLPPGGDTVLHAVGYAVLAAALARAWHPGGDGADGGGAGGSANETTAVFGSAATLGPTGVALAATLVATGFGAGIEGVQAVVPGRTPDLVDAVANLLGAVAGALWWRLRAGRR